MVKKRKQHVLSLVVVDIDAGQFFSPLRGPGFDAPLTPGEETRGADEVAHSLAAQDTNVEQG